jgi:hypothetical protein
MGLVLGVLDMTGALGRAFRGSLLEFAVESLGSKLKVQSLENNPERSEKGRAEALSFGFKDNTANEGHFGRDQAK